MSENLIAAQHKAEQSSSSVEAGMLLSKALKDASRTVEGTKVRMRTRMSRRRRRAEMRWARRKKRSSASSCT